MISRIKGVVLETRLTSLVVDVSGLGYEVTVAPEISSSISCANSTFLERVIYGGRVFWNFGLFLGDRHSFFAM